MPRFLAVVKLEARNTDQPTLMFGTKHIIGFQPVDKERERPRALFPERRAKGWRVTLEALQADRAESLCIGAGQASDRKSG
jgi:hypothetical protein